EAGGCAGIEVLALDRGPGMADVGRCRRDGFSTAGTPGTGLGAIARLSAVAGGYSPPPGGTAGPAPPGGGGGPRRAGPRGGGGVEVGGDAWAVTSEGGRALLLVADGLGHGPLAAEASRAAARVFRENPGLGPAGVLQAAHQALRGTRGAAVAVAELDLGAG